MEGAARGETATSSGSPREDQDVPDAGGTARVFAVADGGGKDGGGVPLVAPAPAPLADGLGIARAMRGLKRRVASRSRRALDAEATVRRVAEEGIWEPLFRPATDRWLNLALVLDVGPTMDVWRSTLEGLCRMLGPLGIFQRFRAWSWDTGRSPTGLAPGYGRVGSRDWEHRPLELVESGGRQLTLVVTDCIGPAWHSGAAVANLAAWAEHGPVALVQMLPESLWSRTALGFSIPVVVRAPFPAPPNLAMLAEPTDPLFARRLRASAQAAGGVTVPVTTLEGGSLRRLTAFLAAAGGARAPGRRLEARGRPHARESALPASTAPEALVRRFLAVTSPPGKELARLLAAAPVINLPVIRTIRTTLMGDRAGQVHEAEVLLGGLLRSVGSPGRDVDPEEVLYDFRPGVRSRLLDVLPGSDVRRVIRAISGYIEDRLGLEPGRVRTLLADPLRQAGDWAISEAPMAEIFIDVLGRLGGDYARLARSLRAGQVRRPLCILHLSDPLFSAESPPSEEAPISTLPAAARDLLERAGLRPDLVAITGDISDRAQPGDFEQATAWIEGRLLPAIGPLDRRNVVVVPGNHDQDWARTRRPAAAREDLLSQISGGLKPGLGEEIARSVRDAFGAFERFAARYCPYDDLLGGGIVIGIRSLRIGLARLHSSWLAAAENEPGAGDYPWIGRDQLDRVFGAVREADVSVALLHHPPERLPGDELSAFRDGLLSSRCRLVLHGHIHTPAGPWRHREPGWEYIALGSNGFAGAQGPPPSFQVITFDPRTSTVNIRALAWDGPDRGWRPASWAGSHSGEETFHFDSQHRDDAKQTAPPPQETDEIEDLLPGIDRQSPDGLIAFSARCARRVLPLALRHVPQVLGANEATSVRDLLEGALDAAERVAAISSTSWSFSPVRLERPVNAAARAAALGDTVNRGLELASRLKALKDRVEGRIAELGDGGRRAEGSNPDELAHSTKPSIERALTIQDVVAAIEATWIGAMRRGGATRDRGGEATSAPADDLQKAARLADFLADSFTTSGLQMFLKLHGYDDVVISVSPNVEPLRYSSTIVRELDRRGLIDTRFFDSLLRERPRQEALIRDLRESWLADRTGQHRGA
jgi:predicted MPP superfamily phosphohydrolase